ncbi:hypothetical protein [Streptomyces sp. 891-h]|uniref:hypothetical protein n=1 Tax=Streptomyces sp. 891-h TaxID=2720714 RepID=UPI001FAAA47C|nr:hypothetical protein [Streptomyces sp. 891-h]UNZ16864.1 hypothetical protein HC362_07065 [Streptomyces sp. 891-h]
MGGIAVRGKKLACSLVCLLTLLGAVGCAGGEGGDGGGGGPSDKDTAEASEKTGPDESASPSPTGRPLSVAEARSALLKADDLSGGWTVGEESLDGKDDLEKTNLRGMKGKSAGCRAFLTRTNRSIGLPVVAVERSLEHTSDGEITARLVSYRDDEAARRAMRQMREAPGKCAEGGTKDGVEIAIQPWSAPQAGDESVGRRLVVMGAPFGTVQARVGSSVVDLTFVGNGDDKALVSRATREAVERLREVAGK